MRTKKIMVIDTETTVKGEVFDMGYIIADLHGNILEEKQYIMVDEFQDKLWYKDKRDLYLQYIEDGIAKLTTVEKVFQETKNLIRLHSVQEVWAYNAGFDTRKLHQQAKKHKVDNPIGHLKHQCIWTRAVQSIMTKAKYQKWAWENEGIAISEKGMIKTGAETAYSFITNNPNYKEEHTSLEDCRIEYEILLQARKSATPFFEGISNNIWLLAQTSEQIAHFPKGLKKLVVPQGQEKQAMKMLAHFKKDLEITVK